MMVLKNKCIVFLFIIFFVLSSSFPVYADEEDNSAGEASSDTQSSVSNDSSGGSDTGATETNDAGQTQAGSENQNLVVNEIVNIASDPAVYENEAAGGNLENPIVEATVDISDTVSSPATISEGASETAPGNDIVSEIVEIQGEEKNVEYLESEVLNVAVPISISVTIDPLELEGKGQIYSKDYKIQNKGDSEVLLTFDDIKLVFSDEANFKKVAEPFSNTFFKGLKTIYMELGFGTRDIPPAVITDDNDTEPISISLANSTDSEEENSHLQFNFSGCVNEAPTLAWKDNDVMVSINYSLDTVRINEIVEQDASPEEQVSSGNEDSKVEPQVPVSAEAQQTGVAELEKSSIDQGTPIQEALSAEADARDNNTQPEASADQVSSSPPSDSSEASTPQASTQTTSSESGEDSPSSTGESSAE